MLQTCAGSICTMKQNDHFMVPDADFTLLQGKDKLTLYQVSRASACCLLKCMALCIIV